MKAISRRRLLSSAISLPLLAAADASRKLKIVVTGGHPGDPEYGCGGTVARYTELGHRVTLLYLNRGEKGCPGQDAKQCSAIRTAEARKACDILNARNAYAGQVDGEAIVDPATYSDFRKLFEAEKPDVVFTHWPIDGHPDHRAISMLAYDAWLRMDKKPAFYYYEVSNGEDTLMFSPTDYVDISMTESKKRTACYAHASQSPDHFYALQHQITTFRGLESGHAQAEAFLRHVKSPNGLLP